MTIQDPLERARAFARQYDLRLPILMAPMAGACPADLAIAVGRAGGMGAAGVLMMDADAIADWTRKVRAGSNGAFQLNTWIPDPAPPRDPGHEAEVADFLGQWGPAVPADAGDAPAPDFDAQVAAMLAAGPPVMSSIMGLYPPEIVSEMKRRGIRWFANATRVDEARAAAAAGADVIIAQGAEAGGHRGTFDADQALASATGLFALLPAIVDAVDIPVVATGGIGDARTIAAALMLGASAVQIGTALLATPEAATPPAWVAAMQNAAPTDTMLTRAFSGRTGRAVSTGYTRAARTAGPDPAPYPIQRNLTAPMRAAALADNNIEAMQAWAGQAARLARAEPADALITRLWSESLRLLSSG